MRLLACLLLLVPLFAPGQETGSPAQAEATEPPKQADDPVQRLDALFDARGDAGLDPEHDKVLSEALTAQPDSFELLIRGARWKIWKADGETRQKVKSALGKEAWEMADKARKLRPDSALAHYYAAASVGLYAQGIGILNALGEGIEGKFNERLDRALALDPTVDNGGPWMAKGRYHYELPWPLRDLNKSRALLEKAVARFPQNTRAHLYLAETLHKDGKKAEARTELAKALTHKGVDAAEAQRVRGMAKKVEKELSRD